MGFIKYVDQAKAQKLFFHISKIHTQGRRPEIGDTVIFEIGKDSKNRLQANNIYIDGVDQQIKVEPKKLNFFDIILILCLIVTIGYAGISFYNSPQLDLSIIISGSVSFVLLVLLGRGKTPKESHYSCASCHRRAQFTRRTINAWNRGIVRLYCHHCYQPREPLYESSRSIYEYRARGKGSLGYTVIIVIFLCYVLWAKA